ncbi:hypothetical protein, partial [Bacillus pumilus]|uniref:hypothetical protein n=3 Tax=Bacillus pumilus TaxID=1408 RepID=UPI001C92FD94
FIFRKGETKMKTLRAAFIKAGYKSASTKRTDVPENKCAQNHTQELSHEEIKELMGIYRPTYKRGRGGAFKSK